MSAWDREITATLANRQADLTAAQALLAAEEKRCMDAETALAKVTDAAARAVLQECLDSCAPHIVSHSYRVTVLQKEIASLEAALDRGGMDAAATKVVELYDAGKVSAKPVVDDSGAIADPIVRAIVTDAALSDDERALLINLLSARPVSNAVVNE